MVGNKILIQFLRRMKVNYQVNKQNDVYGGE